MKIRFLQDLPRISRDKADTLLLLGSALVGSALIRLELDGDRIVHEERLLTGMRERIRDVRQGPDGYLYVLTDAENGKLLRVGLEP